MTKFNRKNDVLTIIFQKKNQKSTRGNPKKDEESDLDGDNAAIGQSNGRIIYSVTWFTISYTSGQENSCPPKASPKRK